MKINCLIVDDEPLARQGMKEYVEEVDFLTLKGLCANPAEAQHEMNKQKIDLLFLDIQMPKMTGIEFVKTLRQQPLVIFTTAYSDYALQGYELEVLDYLVKPVSFERFMKAVNRAKDFFDLKQQSGQPDKKANDYFFIKCDNRYEKIFFDEVLFVKALENYVVIQTPLKQFITYLTFKAVEDYLPVAAFMKVHKSYIISTVKIEKISGNEIIMGTHHIPISRNLKDEVMMKIVNDKLIKRQG